MTHTPGEHLRAELESQPETWTRALTLGSAGLPSAGERAVVLGCGTSWFMGQAYAAERERRQLGQTDCFAASESPRRTYDVAVLLSRSGTTTEVIDAARRVQARRTISIVGDATTPLAALTDESVALPFADETSVVQTRFATSALVLLLASVGQDLGHAIEDARLVLNQPVDQRLVDAPQITFLGSGWTVGLAHEAALKMREATQAWTESYVAMEYRHGPISIASSGRLVWMFGAAPAGLADQVRATGATFVESEGLEPLAQLVSVHRGSLERALVHGLDPDAPRNLTRAVVLGA